jgi:hypothetical protein
LVTYRLKEQGKFGSLCVDFATHIAGHVWKFRSAEFIQGCMHTQNTLTHKMRFTHALHTLDHIHYSLRKRWVFKEVSILPTDFSSLPARLIHKLRPSNLNPLWP